MDPEHLQTGYQSDFALRSENIHAESYSQKGNKEKIAVIYYYPPPSL